MQKSEAFKKRVDFECGYGWKHPINETKNNLTLQRLGETRKRKIKDGTYSRC